MWVVYLVLALALFYFIGRANSNKNKLSHSYNVKTKESTQIKPLTAAQNKSNLKSRQNILNVMSIEDIILNPAILKLLWFLDGPNKNYNPESIAENETDINIRGHKIKISFSMSFGQEPSLLRCNLPVSKPKLGEDIEKLGYYPSYQNLSPEQRWIYLTWLRDVTANIDIGYVFIFYYGLERQLFFGQSDDAFNMIIKLRAVHHNSSFQHYSSNAIIMAALYFKRTDWLALYLEQEQPFSSGAFVTDFSLLAKKSMQLNLRPQEVIALSSAVGFTNKRYIKSNPELFYNVLENKLTAKYGSPNLPLSEFNLLNCPMTEQVIMANISIDHKQRYMQIPALTKNKELISLVYTLLNDTHETVKGLLKELRKINKAPKQIENIKDTEA